MKFKLVDLAKYGFIVEPRYYFYGWSKLKSCLARPSVAKALLGAKKYLPPGYNFKIWDGYRTSKTQRLMRESFRKRLKNTHPNWSQREISQALNKFAGAVKQNPRLLEKHFNGGALDLTIVNTKKEELDMGTDFDDLTKKAALDYFERRKQYSSGPEKIIKKNRCLLKKAMLRAGFKPFLPEWWHWSYNK